MNTAVTEVENKLIAAKERWVHQIDTALETLKMVDTFTAPVSGEPKKSSFAGMGIADAAVSYLRTVKEKKGTQQILEALTAEGLKTQAGKTPDYNTIYTLLRRRAEKVGDIKSTKGKWALVEKLHTLAA